MLVNFAVEPETLSAGQLIGNFKRGSWMKKRIDAKRILHSNKKHTASVVQTPAPVVVQPKAAENNIAAPAVSSFGMKRSAPVSENQAAAKRLKAPAGFTSSIFTSNPTISVAAKPEKKQIAQPIFSDTVFAGLGLHSVLVNHLTKLKLVTPTPIQRAAIPVLVKSCDKDAIIQAQTGSGKTYCFLLPILERLIVAAAEHEKQQGSDFFSRATGTFAIILAPTRELAQQIETVLNTLLRYTSGSNQEDEDQSFRHWIVSGIVTGGEKRKSEKSRLRKGISILVATPGRLLDHLKTTDAFMIGNLRWLILDEADNLLNLGFEETLKEILEILEFKRKLAIQHNYRISIPSLPEMRQTILCSATIESGVQALAKQALVDPEFITGKTEKDETKTEDPADNAIAIPQQLKQQYVIAPAKLRLVGMVGLIRHLVATVKSAKIIIYLSTGDSVDWHFDSFARLGEAPNRDGDVEELTESEQAEKQAKDETANRKKLEDGYDTPLSPGTLLFKLHGSMCQTDRQATFAGFSRQKNGSSVLLCTDVAARGLDMPDVTDIIQYDPPSDSKDYIHRIGRTARLGKQGSAFLFLLPSEVEYLTILQELSCNLAEIPLVTLLQTLLPLCKSRVSKKNAAYQVAATDVHMNFERFVISDKTNEKLAHSAFKSFIRSYTTHIQAERHIFHIKKVHLGHLAKSFGLREAPAGLVRGAKEKERKGPQVTTAGLMRKKANEMELRALTSEFAA